MGSISGIVVTVILALHWTNGATKNIVPMTDSGPLSLRIMHTNDMHARFEQTSAKSSRCLPKDVKANKCYGGFARIATLVRQARNSSTPCLFLNAGDTYQGSEWFTVHKWRIVAKFLDILSPDAISLGNHEFDNGPEGLVPFLHNVTYPVVTANLDLTGEPELAASKLLNSTILVVNGTRIGVIGYLTLETNVIAAIGKVKFLDEIESIKREAAALSAKGVKILIALGHSGYKRDKEIAAEVDGIDLVIGGHTNTFLHSHQHPDEEIPEGLYPTVVTQKNGRKVYVVQAYAYTKYMGNMSVDFDANGEITEIHGKPILVNGSIEQAKDVLEELEKWRPALLALQHEVVGSTLVLLDGRTENCRKKECNLGNLIADAMVDYHARQYVDADAWTDAAIAILNSGTIRSSISKSTDQQITKSDVLTVLPFNNVQIKVSMNGSTFLQALEWNVNSLDLNAADLNGKFLQFSGVQVIFDLSQPPNSRVVSVMMRCADCKIPTYTKLDENAMYGVLMPDFLATGGNGFLMFKGLSQTTDGITTDEILIEYFKKGPVHPDVEGRINYASKPTDGRMVSSLFETKVKS